LAADESRSRLDGRLALQQLSVPPNAQFWTSAVVGGATVRRLAALADGSLTAGFNSST